MCSSKRSCHVARGVRDNFLFRELGISFLGAAVRRGGGRSARLQVREEKFAFFEFGAVGVAFSCELGFAVL